MEFCPKCGAILMMKKSGVGCPRCSYKAKGKVNMEMKEMVNEKTSIGVVGEKGSEMHPITDYKCRKCGHNKSYFWTRQMRSGDEAESRFYKCVKCKSTVRED